MHKWLEAVTGDDNQTLEPAYCWGAIFALAGLGLQIYCSVTGKPFDLQGYGIGAGALLTGLGLGKKLGSGQ
ncbi:MAG: hypothetical protein JO171_12110 [Paludibacterium sp.]|uniref:hypothetical protein n=1 Tax=Paludibacterium sp. TaxID=1917523 RepID=UPI0025EE9FA5|nr:hypothetical protein [Paludibacterium sp.]MBV8047895.1 hypothetical protein [Paludibacterium sp.]